MNERLRKWKEEQIKETTIIDTFEDYRRQSIEAEHEKIRAESINTLLEKIPFRFNDKSFDDYVVSYTEQKRVKLICQRFVETFSDRVQQGSSAMFLGQPGTGKTLLSLIMYRAIVQAGYSAQYEPSLIFLKTFQEKLYQSQASYQSFIDYYKNIQFLVLDEATESLNKGGLLSEYEKKLLFDVVNARYERKNNCTIVVSNHTKKELTNRLGQPIVDRLSEQGMALIFDWPSYRQKKE